MKKFMKKIALVLSCVMMMGLLGGCGSFDAAAYLSALLDNSYKNDSTAVVAQEIATAEEAAAIYEEGLDVQVDAFVSVLGISEDQADGLRAALANVLAGAKYTVGEAEKQSDGSYVVTVSYEKMNVFGPATEIYMVAVEEISTAYTEAALAGEEVSQEEMIVEVLDAFVAALNDAAANATYDEAQTTTVRIELVDDQYAPNEADLQNLTNVLFDNE